MFSESQELSQEQYFNYFSDVSQKSYNNRSPIIGDLPQHQQSYVKQEYYGNISFSLDESSSNLFSMKNHQFDQNLNELHLTEIKSPQIDMDEQKKVTKKPKETRKKQTKKNSDKKKKDTKNLLINFIKLVLDYILKHDPTAEDEQFWNYLYGKKSINRKDYENLFKIERYQNILAMMFAERHLQRQLQLSRSSKKVRPAYLRKIKVFNQAFQKKWFPRIN